jgi:hypothetical protein
VHDGARARLVSILRHAFPRRRVPPPHVDARPADAAEVVRAT